MTSLSGIALLHACASSLRRLPLVIGCVLLLAAPAAAANDWNDQADAAARQIRESRQAATPVAASRALEQALATLDRIIASDDPAAPRRRARLDRIVALSRLARWDEAMDDFDQLRQTDPGLPSYAISAAGDAAAGLREPELALELYEQALRLNPDDDSAHAGRIFALADLDRLDRAEAILVERLDRRDDRNDRLRLALIRAWGGRVDQSAGLIAGLAADAPRDAELARQQAGLELLRDRPFSALDAYDRALAESPGYVGAAVDRIAVLDRLGRQQEAEQSIAELADKAADWPPYRRVLESRRHDRGALIESRLRGGRGGDREIASGEVRSETTAWSPVFGPELRLYAAYRRAYADFRGTSLEDQRVAAGLRWQHRTVRVQIEADRAQDDLVDADGAAVSVDWRVNDDWSLAAAMASNAFDLPLRARGAGTTGDRVSLAARYSPAGQHWVRLSVGQVDYSDGNRRQEAGLMGSLRIPLHHDLAVTVSPGLFAGRNRRDDVPYYSPRRDGSAEVAASLEHRIHARLGRQHAQRVELFAGSYAQQGHGPQAIGGLRYEYSFVPGAGRRLFGRIGRDRRAYDGVPEYQSFAEFGVQYSW